MLKSVHYFLAMLSLAGFLLRGAWMLMESPLLQHRITRILPHIIDTFFLIAGLVLAHRIFQYPFSHDWLTAKLLGLIVYIMLATVALKLGKTRRIRLITFVSAIVVFLWMISVAMTKSPAGFFGVLVRV